MITLLLFIWSQTYFLGFFGAILSAGAGIVLDLIIAFFIDRLIFEY